MSQATDAKAKELLPDIKHHQQNVLHLLTTMRASARQFHIAWNGPSTEKIDPDAPKLTQPPIQEIYSNMYAIEAEMEEVLKIIESAKMQYLGE